MNKVMSCDVDFDWDVLYTPYGYFSNVKGELSTTFLSVNGIEKIWFNKGLEAFEYRIDIALINAINYLRKNGVCLFFKMNFVVKIEINKVILFMDISSQTISCKYEVLGEAIEEAKDRVVVNVRQSLSKLNLNKFQIAKVEFYCVFG